MTNLIPGITRQPHFPLEKLHQRGTELELLIPARPPQPGQPGLFGAATSPAEAQVLRLSAVYAALDRSAIITLPHLKAALAVWEYRSASAPALFGTSTGNLTANRIKLALEGSTDGLSREQIRCLFWAASAATGSRLPSNNSCPSACSPITSGQAGGATLRSGQPCRARN